MKKSFLFLLVSTVIIALATIISFAASSYHVDQTQLQNFSGKTAVTTADVTLGSAYSLTYSDGATYTDTLIPMTSDYSVKKGNIVIVLEDADTNTYRVTIPPMGDAGILSGFLDKKYVSYDKTLISNANQCIFKNVTGTNSNTNAKSTISGQSVIYNRTNGKLLIRLPGGDPTSYWINVSDASFNFDKTCKDVSYTAYQSITKGVTPTPTPKPGNLNQVILKVTMNKLQYTVNGTPMMFDVAPYIDTKANRSMIPMRFIAEAFGATVNWDDATKTQTIRLNGKTFKLTQNVALPNGMGTPVLVKDRFFVPLRYVSQELGASVDWDDATQTNTIIYYK